MYYLCMSMRIDCATQACITNSTPVQLHMVWKKKEAMWWNIEIEVSDRINF